MENQIQIILDSILFQNQYPNHLEVLSWCFSPCLSFKASCLPAPWSQTANCLVSYDTIWAFYKMEAQDFMNYHDCHHWNSHKKGVPLWDKSMLWTSYPSCFFDGNCPPSLHSRIPKSHWYWSPRLRQKPSRRRESLLCGEKTVSKPSMSMGFLKHSILGIHRKGYLSFTPALVQHWTNQLLPEPGSPSGVRFYGSLGVPILDQNYPLAIKDDKPKNLWFWHQRAPCTSRFTSTGHQRATYRASVSDCHRWPSKNGISHHLARIDLEKWGATKWMTKYDKGFLVMGQSSFIFMGNFPSFWARDGHFELPWNRLSGR